MLHHACLNSRPAWRSLALQTCAGSCIWLKLLINELDRIASTCIQFALILL
jgi:hypothetical protein